MSHINRRRFLTTSAAATAGAGALSASPMNALHLADETLDQDQDVKPFKRDWRLRYAPRLDWGKGNLIEKVERVAEYGFTAVEFNGLGRKPIKEVEALKKRMDQLNMQMGIFVANWKGRPAHQGETQKWLESLKHTLEVHKAIGNNFCTVLAGNVDKHMTHDAQTQLCIDNLKRGAELLEGSDLTLVVEPLNPINHRGYFVVVSPHANHIMKKVGSRHVKILFDIYHQQISEGNLIHNIRKYWDEIAYFQVGDVPGRKEPLTGEINYRNVFKAIHDKGYTGILGMEHGLSGKRGAAGMHKCFKAYEWCDKW
jgi:hydroxypyruvate isomerase